MSLHPAPGRSLSPEEVLAAEAFLILLGTLFCSLFIVLFFEGVSGFGSEPLCEADIIS